MPLLPWRLADRRAKTERREALESIVRAISPAPRAYGLMPGLPLAIWFLAARLTGRPARRSSSH